jgi:hypothetical protein
MSDTFEYNVVTRDDIVSKISRTVEEHYIMLDIVRNIELNAKQAILDDKECHIPYLGTFWHNRRHLYWDNIDKFKEAERTMNPVDFINYRKDVLAEACRNDDARKHFIAYRSINKNKYPKTYRFFVRKYGIKRADLLIGTMTLNKYNIPIGDTLVRL